MHREPDARERVKGNDRPLPATLDCPACGRWTFFFAEPPGDLEQLDCDACGAVLLVLAVDGPHVATVRVDSLTPAEARYRVLHDGAPFWLAARGHRGMELAAHVRRWRLFLRWRELHPVGSRIRRALERWPLSFLHGPPVELESRLYHLLRRGP